MTVRTLVALTAAAALALRPAPSDAMTCSFTSVVGVSFGSYSVLATSPVDTAGSVTYLCESGPADFITIDIDAGTSGTFSARTLVNGGSTLSYNLYESATRTGNPWGNGAGGTTHYGPVLAELDTPTVITVYGRIPAQQNVPAGAYADTVVVTINF
jgi:spore coat protein U-like protein